MAWFLIMKRLAIIALIGLLSPGINYLEKNIYGWFIVILWTCPAKFHTPAEYGSLKPVSQKT